MTILPAAIIVVNNDLVTSIQDKLSQQLHLNEIITGDEFDSRVSTDSAYPDSVRLDGQRILVIRPLDMVFDRTLVDVIIFIKNGLASVLTNKFGPPGATYPVCRLYWGQLCIF